MKLWQNRWVAWIAVPALVGCVPQPAPAPTPPPVSAVPAIELSPTPDDVPELPDDAVADEAIYLGPYLQAVGPTAATLRFETGQDRAVQVAVAGGEQKEASLTDAEVRLHEVRISSLQPDTGYTYRLLTTDREPEELAAGAFRTWPRAPKAIQFFVYGDSRGQPKLHRRLCERMNAAADEHLFVLHTGDLVPDGRVWEQWRSSLFEPGAELFRTLCLFPAAGNHERNSDLYRAYFSLPEPEWYYGFTIGPLHVTVIDNYRDLAGADLSASAQGRWLLEEADAAASSPWRVAVMHVPFYSRGPHTTPGPDGKLEEGEITFARQHLEPLLRRHGYQVVFAGHDHLYERSLKDGLLMITTGGGGAWTYAPRPASQNPYSQKCVRANHYCDVALDGTSLTLHAYDPDGGLVDAFTFGLDGTLQVLSQ